MNYKLLAIFLLSISITNSKADEIYLNNGDRLTGQIIAAKDGNLTIKTSFAGEVTIQWTAIQSLISDQAVSVKLDDGMLLKGKLIRTDDGTIKLAADDRFKTDPLPLASIVAINPPPAEKRIALHGTVNVGGSVETGNTDKQAFHADAELIARGANNRVTLGGAYNQSEDTGIESSNNALAYAKYDHFLNEKWYAYANTLFTKDKFKDLNLRSSLGAGLGYQFWETDLTNLSVEFGPSYVNEDLIVADDRSFASGRWAVNYDRWMFDKLFQFFHFHEGLIAFEDTSDIFLRSRTGIRVPLLNGFTVTAEADIDYDNVPSPGNKKTDTRYLLNAGYAW